MCLCLFSLSCVFAETLTITNGFKLSSGETRSIPLHGMYMVKKLFIQAEGINNDSSMEVSANGDTKGTIYAPGSDPHYVVTVSEVTDSIEFSATMGSMHVISVKAVLEESSVSGYYPTHGNFYVQTGEVTRICTRIIDLVENLRPFAYYDDYGKFLLPIKKAAARTYSIARANSDLSRKTYASVLVLMSHIDFAQFYIERTFEQDHAFDFALELVSLREKLKDMLE